MLLFADLSLHVVALHAATRTACIWDDNCFANAASRLGAVWLSSQTTAPLLRGTGASPTMAPGSFPTAIAETDDNNAFLNFDDLPGDTEALKAFKALHVVGRGEDSSGRPHHEQREGMHGNLPASSIHGAFGNWICFLAARQAGAPMDLARTLADGMKQVFDNTSGDLNAGKRYSTKDGPWVDALRQTCSAGWTMMGFAFTCRDAPHLWRAMNVDDYHFLLENGRFSFNNMCPLLLGLPYRARGCDAPPRILGGAEG